MAPEELKNHDEEVQKPKESTDTKLNIEVEKNDGNDTTAAMNLMATEKIEAQKEIDALGLSIDELKSSEYTNKFTTAQKDFGNTTQLIISDKKLSSEEKIKALQNAFEKFEKEIGSIKGTKEAQDAKIAKENSKRMEEGDKQNEQKNQEFKDTLLKSIQEITAKKIQEQKLAAEKLGNKEQKTAQDEARDSIQSTNAFGPPGNLEKEKSLKV